MFFGQANADGSYPNPPVVDMDNWYWCTVAGGNTLILDKPYTGDTSNGNVYRRPTWQNLTGRGSQPFMEGIAGWALNYAALALDGFDNTTAANYRTAMNNVVDWIWTYGRSPATKGLFYGVEFSNCTNLAVLPVYNCAQDVSASSNERAYQPETNAAFAQKYLNTNNSVDLTRGDEYYTDQFARSGYASPFPGDGYFAELIDPCCSTYNEKAYGQTFGVGQGHQWPGARLGGVSPPSLAAVPVNIDLAGAGAASAQVVVTQPNSAQQKYSCSTSPCTVQVDQRQGAHWAQVQYLSASGAVISSAAPILLGQAATPTAAPTTTTAANATAAYSASSQPVTLSATVTSTAGTVNAGTVTFTVQGTTVTSGTVANGAASAVYTLPAGAAGGSYPITAAYSGSASFASSTDFTHSLMVNAGPVAATTTTVANATVTYSANSQTVTLSATVTSATSTMNAGTVTFTVQSTPVTSGTVTNGAATAVYTVPAGAAAGSYPITAVYNASGNFSESSGTASLTVKTAPTTTAAANALADYNASSQPVTLSATVTSAAGTVNAGTVTFTVQGTPVTSGTVTNGAASAVYTLPAGAAAGSYPITAAFSGSANFASSTDSAHSLTVSAGGSGLSGYTYSRAIAISHLQVPNTDQNNFPVLISITDALLKSVGNGGHVASASGYDLIFTSDSAGNSLLPFERESYNPTTGSAIFWVQVPVLSHSSDTQIYMFYGNSAGTDQSNPSGVWDSNYKGVWHLNDDTRIPMWRIPPPMPTPERTMPIRTSRP
jgi:hypothetical protein